MKSVINKLECFVPLSVLHTWPQKHTQPAEAWKYFLPHWPDNQPFINATTLEHFIHPWITLVNRHTLFSPQPCLTIWLCSLFPPEFFTWLCTAECTPSTYCRSSQWCHNPFTFQQLGEKITQEFYCLIHFTDNLLCSSVTFCFFSLSLSFAQPLQSSYTNLTVKNINLRHVAGAILFFVFFIREGDA